jgi:beta-lactamase class A
MAITRAVVISVGLALLVGILSQLLQKRPANSRQDAPPLATPVSSPPALDLQTGLTDLQAQLQQLVPDPTLGLHALFVDIDSGAYAGINSEVKISAASTIKVPILVAFFQAVDAGRVKLDEELVTTQELMGGGSGTLQFKPVGTKLSALSAATLMITVSDNTATNLIIQRLGGLEALNQTFREWGLTETQLNALLPDLDGTNTTSAKDMVTLLSLVEKGNLLQLRSRDWVLDIMRRTQTRTLLPQGLDPEARIANKTGDIRSLVGDVGIIDMPNGRRYLAAVLMARETPNDPRAQELIRQVSQTVYQYWSQSEISSNP